MILFHICNTNASFFLSFGALANLPGPVDMPYRSTISILQGKFDNCVTNQANHEVAIAMLTSYFSLIIEVLPRH